MSSGQIHYEIHIKPPRGKWQFYGAMELRDKALKQAKELAGGGAAVQVMKETLGADGNYLSVRIFQEGDCGDARPNAGKTDSFEALPCFRPLDLYSYEARKTIVRLLQDSLNRWKITSLELLHSPVNLDMLESTGTVLQAAVQKMAIAQAQAGAGTVGERVKILHKLVSDAMVMVYVDRDKKRIPSLKNKTIGELARQLVGDPRCEYLLNSAITACLQNCNDWDSKLVVMLEFIKDVPHDDSTLRKFCLNIIDGYVSEILSSSSAIKDVVGEQKDLGGALQRMVELSSGLLKDEEITSPGLASLNFHFGAGELPETRTAIIRRVLTELEGPKRLTQDSLAVEVKFLRRLASKVALACGNLIPNDEVLAAFRTRSERLISPDALDAYLGEAENPAEKAERLLYIGDNIVGDKNKRKLTAILLAMLEAPVFNQYFMSAEVPVSNRLRLLCDLQNRVAQSELDAPRKQLISQQMDTICFAIIETNKLFDRVISGQDNPLNKSLALLKLASANILTRGKSRDTAQRLALGFIQQPGALKNYLGNSADSEVSTKVEELRTMLHDAGIDPESVLGRHAA